MIKKVARAILPAGSRRRMAAGRVKNWLLHGTYGPSYKYKIWIKRHEPGTLEPILKIQNKKISIVVPAFNTRKKYIKELVDSVKEQTYTNWQLCLADGSTDASVAAYTKELCRTDDRIAYIKVSHNLGISGNTNKALTFADGDFIAFLDHDDVLPKWAINELAAAIKANPKGDIFYSDEDRLTENGKVRTTPLLKPNWSPDLLLSANYVTHLFAIRKKTLDQVGRLRPEYDGSQDYDLILRAMDRNPVIIHIPKILYHMRMAKGSTAREITSKDYAHIAGRRALKDYLSRNKIDARVLGIEGRPTNHRIKYAIKGEPLVSIIIPFKDKIELLRTCLKSLEMTAYKNYELILISNNSQEKRTQDYLASIKSKNIRILEYNQKFNYSAINNFGRRAAKGSVLVFLNNDTEVVNKEWLQELVSVACRREIGAVGPLLFYPDKTIQHAGVVVGIRGTAGHIFRNLHLGTLTPFWLPDWPRNYLAVTGACLAIETSKFDKVKGFNEDFVIAGSDVVLGLDLYNVGFSNLYWPFAKLIHHESKSVGSYKNAPISDYNFSLKHYKPYLNYGDPYFNPNLSIESEIPILRTNYE